MTAAAEAVRQRAPGRAPRVALVLGSGLGPLAERVRDAVRIPYDALPGWRSSTVPGHPGELVVGTLAGREVAVLAGRSHVYEGIGPEAITAPVDTLRALGVETLVLTNASGSLRAEVGPGELVAIADHINGLGFTPLVGPEFVSLRDAYDPGLRAELHAAADACGTTLHDGIYLAVPGPSFETPAEIRAFRTLGADLVGMSTVPEAIAARHAGLRVAAVSVVTNLAEGMTNAALSHAQTLEAGRDGASRLGPLLERWLHDG